MLQADLDPAPPPCHPLCRPSCCAAHSWQGAGRSAHAARSQLGSRCTRCSGSTDGTSRRSAGRSSASAAGSRSLPAAGATACASLAAVQQSPCPAAICQHAPTPKWLGSVAPRRRPLCCWRVCTSWDGLRYPARWWAAAAHRALLFTALSNSSGLTRSTWRTASSSACIAAMSCKRRGHNPGPCDLPQLA